MIKILTKLINAWLCVTNCYKLTKQEIIGIIRRWKN